MDSEPLPRKFAAIQHADVAANSHLIGEARAQPARCQSRARDIAISLSFLAALVFCSPVSAQERLSVIFYSNYYPWSYNREGVPAGLFVDLTKKIMESTSLNVSYEIYPFKRAMLLGKQGQGLVSGLYKTSEREHYFNFSNPYYKDNLILLSDRKLPETLVESNFAPINGWRIGVVNGMSYGAAIDNAIETGNIIGDRANTDLANYKKLKLGRIEGMLLDKIYAKKLIHDHNDEMLIIHPESLVQGDLHVLAPKRMKNGREILDQINAALLKIKQDGSHQEILDNFMEQR
jgi:polar amino acid transport system substrate-binding protein